MNKKNIKSNKTTGTPATVKGMAASSAEFVPNEIDKDKINFVNSLDEVYDYIPKLKTDKFH